MNKLINLCPDTIYLKNVFRLGVDMITNKSYEDNVNFTIPQLQKALAKSHDLECLIKKKKDCNIRDWL